MLTQVSQPDMTTNRHKFFRWTPRTARITFMYAVFVPVIFGIVAYKTDVSRDPLSSENAGLCILTQSVPCVGQIRFPSEEEGRRHCRILRIDGEKGEVKKGNYTYYRVLYRNYPTRGFIANAKLLVLLSLESFETNE